MSSGPYGRLHDSFEENPPNRGNPQARVTFGRGTSTEYYQLCDQITTNIFTINNATTNLEKMGKLIGSMHDSQVIRDRISQLSADTISYVGDTKNLVKSVLLLVQGDKQRKIRAHRLQSEFQASAARFSQLQKNVVTTFSHARLPSDMIKHADNRDTTSEIVRAGEQDLAQKQEFQNMEYEMAMQQERQYRVEALEKDMVDINDIMRELSTMTAEQGEIVTSIEDNVENAASYVEEGRTQLIKAAGYQNKHRKRCCILLLILVVVSIIIGIIIAIHNSSS